MAKKNPTLDIDEQAIIDSFVHSGKNELKNIDKPDKKSKTVLQKKQEAERFAETYLKNQSLKSRHLVYISNSKHETIARILSIAGDKDLTVSKYIENVLEAHFEMSKEDILNFIQSKRKEDYEDCFNQLSNNT